MNRSVMLTIFLVFSSAAMFDFYGAEPGKTSAPKQDSAEKDYKSELPRIAPKEPREALKTFKLQPGFRIELVAAEPLLRDPVAMDFDENGRMFVVELPEYNQYENKAFKGHGGVRLLEDIDDDGQYDDGKHRRRRHEVEEDGNGDDGKPDGDDALDDAAGDQRRRHYGDEA